MDMDYHDSKNQAKVLEKKQDDYQSIGPAFHQNSKQSESSSEEDDNDIDVEQMIKKQAMQRAKTQEQIQKKVKIDEDNTYKTLIENDEQNNEQQTEGERQDRLTQQYRDLKLPISCETYLQGHSKPVSAICLERNGIRMITGGWDSEVRFWDFNGMNKSMNSFRIVNPIENHIVQNLSYNSEEQEILVISANAQPKIISREGKDLVECIKGDQYLQDLKLTKGHVSSCYDGTFHPTEKNLFITSSMDGTIRLWDRQKALWGLEEKQRQANVIVCNPQGKRIKVFSCNYLKDGNMVAGACSDGTIKCYDLKGYLNRPNILFNQAHTVNSHVSKLIPFEDGHRFLTRAFDHTLKLWDIRKSRTPVHVWANLYNDHQGSKVAISPDEKFIVTGTCYNRATKDEAMIKIYDTQSYEEKVSISTGDVSIGDIKWHKVLNQIFVGMTDGSTMALFDPVISTRGVKSCLVKKEREYAPVEFDKALPIRTPHALPLFKDAPLNKKRTYEKQRQDTIQTKEPLRPPPIRATGGRSGGPSTVTQHLLRVGNQKENIFEDPQEALTKLQPFIDQKHKLVTTAYEKTQPKTIFDTETAEHEENVLLQNIKKICPNCGLKICVCESDPVNQM